MDCQLHSGSSPAETAECWLADWVTGCVADWLVSWIHVKYDLHWEHVVANPSPRYAYSPIVCDSWLYLHRGEERQVGIRLCISVAELRVRSTSGWLWGVCVCAVHHCCVSNFITHARTFTRTRSHSHTTVSSLVAEQPQPACTEQQRRHTNTKPGTLVHSYTNKQTHLLLLASRSDNQPKEGRQTKQTV